MICFPSPDPAPFSFSQNEISASACDLHTGVSETSHCECPQQVFYVSPVAVCQHTGYANQTATRHRVVIPTKWNWGMTTGTTTPWRVAPPKRYPKTKHCLFRAATWDTFEARDTHWTVSQRDPIGEEGLREQRFRPNIHTNLRTERERSTSVCIS